MAKHLTSEAMTAIRAACGMVVLSEDGRTEPITVSIVAGVHLSNPLVSKNVLARFNDPGAYTVTGELAHFA